MTLFAHVETGFAQDVWEDADDAAYRKRFAADMVQSWTVVEAPSDTVSGRVYSNGSWGANPAPPVPSQPPSLPLIISATAFNELCFAHLGGGATGMARFQAILDAAEAAGGAAKACVTHYDKSNLFEKADVATFFAILVGATIMTQAEADAVVNNWPVS